MAAQDKPLELKWVPLDQVRLWQGNPKKHSMEELQESIRRYGFGDPPKYDSALDAIVYGNGRSEAVALLQAAGEDPPRGIATDKDGTWLLPVIFGVDQESAEVAARFGVDHNSTGLAGFDAVEIARLYDGEALASLTEGWGENGDDGLVLDFMVAPEEPESPEEFPVVDESLPTEHTCPECGYKWSGSA